MRLPLLFFLFSILMSSCNQEQRDKSSIVDSLRSQTKDTNGFKQISHYSPKKYHKDSFDTLLTSSNNLRLMISKYPLMDSYIYKEVINERERIIEKLYYRNYVAEIRLFKNDSVLIDTLLRKEDFPGIETGDFIKEAILHNIWFYSYNPDTNEISLNAVINIPDTDFGYFYKIRITDKGKIIYKIEEIT